MILGTFVHQGSTVIIFVGIKSISIYKSEGYDVGYAFTQTLHSLSFLVQRHDQRKDESEVQLAAHRVRLTYEVPEE